MIMMMMNMSHREVERSIKSLTSPVETRRKGRGKRRKRKKKRTEVGRGRRRRGGNTGEARRKRGKYRGIGESGTIRPGDIRNMMIGPDTEHHKPK